MNKSSQLLADTLVVTYRVTPAERGERLDAFLSRHSPRSRSKIQTAIDEGRITVKRESEAHHPIGRIRASTSLLAEDRVLVTSIKGPEPAVSFDYKILHDDGVLLIVNKPPNLPVHPAGSFYFNTLLTHLRTQGFTRELDESSEIYLPHRIDRETSGVLVMTRTPEAAKHIADQFAARTLSKRYWAIAHGVTPDEFTVDAPLGSDPESRIGMRIAVLPETEGGQVACTRFKRLSVHEVAGIGVLSLVECRPETGRQHQIRVHLLHAGHPILGDKIYGVPEDRALSYLARETSEGLLHPRHALHARGIKLVHPVSGQWVEFEAPLTEDLRKVIETE